MSAIISFFSSAIRKIKLNSCMSRPDVMDQRQNVGGDQIQNNIELFRNSNTLNDEEYGRLDDEKKQLLDRKEYLNSYQKNVLNFLNKVNSNELCFNSKTQKDIRNNANEILKLVEPYITKLKKAISRMQEDCNKFRTGNTIFDKNALQLKKAQLDKLIAIKNNLSQNLNKIKDETSNIKDLLLAQTELALSPCFIWQPEAAKEYMFAKGSELVYTEQNMKDVNNNKYLKRRIKFETSYEFQQITAIINGLSSDNIDGTLNDIKNVKKDKNTEINKIQADLYNIPDYKKYMDCLKKYGELHKKTEEARTKLDNNENYQIQQAKFNSAINDINNLYFQENIINKINYWCNLNLEDNNGEFSRGIQELKAKLAANNAQEQNNNVSIMNIVCNLLRAENKLIKQSLADRANVIRYNIIKKQNDLMNKKIELISRIDIQTKINNLKNEQKQKQVELENEQDSQKREQIIQELNRLEDRLDEINVNIGQINIGDEIKKLRAEVGKLNKEIKILIQQKNLMEYTKLANQEEYITRLDTNIRKIYDEYNEAKNLLNNVKSSNNTSYNLKILTEYFQKTIQQAQQKIEQAKANNDRDQVKSIQSQIDFIKSHLNGDEIKKSIQLKNPNLDNIDDIVNKEIIKDLCGIIEQYYKSLEPQYKWIERFENKDNLEEKGRVFTEYSLAASEADGKAKLVTPSYPDGFKLNISQDTMENLFTTDEKGCLNLAFEQKNYGDCYLLSALDSIMDDEEMMIKFLNNFEEVPEVDEGGNETGKTKLQFNIKLENGESLSVPIARDKNGKILTKGVLSQEKQTKADSPIVNLMEEIYTIKRMNDIANELDLMPNNLKNIKEIQTFKNLVQEINSGNYDIKTVEDINNTFKRIMKKLKSKSFDKIQKDSIDRKKLSYYLGRRMTQYVNDHEIAFANPNEGKFIEYLVNRYCTINNALVSFNENSNILSENFLNGGMVADVINTLVEDKKSMTIPNSYVMRDFTDIKSISMQREDFSFSTLGYNRFSNSLGGIELVYKQSQYNNLNNLIAMHALEVSGMVDGDIQWINPWDNRKINTVQLAALEIFNTLMYDRIIN